MEAERISPKRTFLFITFLYRLVFIMLVHSLQHSIQPTSFIVLVRTWVKLTLQRRNNANVVTRCSNLSVALSSAIFGGPVGSEITREERRKGLPYMTTAKCSDFGPPLPLVRIFTQPPLLNSLTSSAFPGPPLPLSADVINGSSLTRKCVVISAWRFYRAAPPSITRGPAPQ